MAKEFDIYLRDRLTQCDIIVYSIPFRDGLTVMDAMILESCIESYTLQKFVAMQTGSELVSHIDKMIKICREKLNFGARFNADAAFQIHYAVNADPFAVDLSVDTISSAATVFAAAESQMVLGADRLRAYIGKSGGRAESAIEPAVELRDSLKTAIERASAPIAFGTDSLSMKKQGAMRVSSGVEITSGITELCYRVYRAASTGIDICAQVLDTEIHFSLGSGEDVIEMTSGVDGELMRKYELVQNAVSILARLTESITQFMAPEETPVEFSAEVSSIVKRHRLLGEMDEDTLADFDDMTLDEIDYVIV